jgi:hypothetical protein
MQQEKNDVFYVIHAEKFRVMSSLEFCKGAEKRWRYNSVDSSVVGYSPDSNDVSTEADESPLLRAVTKQRLLKTSQTAEDLACSDL